MVFAVLDTEIDGNSAIEYPSSYLYGPKKGHFSLSIYLKYALNGMWHGVVSFFVPYWLLGMGGCDESGKVSRRPMKGLNRISVVFSDS